MNRRRFLQATTSAALCAGCGAKPDVKPADAGPEPDAGAEDAALPEHAEGNDAAPPPATGDEDFPAWTGGDASESSRAVLMFRGNTRRNFQGTGKLGNSLVLKWTHRTSALTVAGGGGARFWTGTGWTGQAVKWGRRVFFGALDGRFYCLDAEGGDVVWSLKTKRMFKSSPCFYKGRLYVGNVDNFLRAIDARTGKVLWKLDMKSDCDSSPVVSGGALYAASESGFLHALDPETGKPFFKLDLGGHKGPGGSQGIESSPAIADGELWVATYDGLLHRIDLATQTIKSKIPTGDDTDASPVLTDDAVFVAAEAKNPILFCIDRKSETHRWTFRAEGGFWSTPAVVGGRVFVGCEDHRMVCLDEKNGALIWEFRASRAIWSSPCVVDGKVIFGSYDGFLYMLDAATGKELFRQDLAGPVLSTACVVDGWVYIGSGDGNFYAFASA